MGGTRSLDEKLPKALGVRQFTSSSAVGPAFDRKYELLALQAVSIGIGGMSSCFMQEGEDIRRRVQLQNGTHMQRSVVVIVLNPDRFLSHNPAFWAGT